MMNKKAILGSLTTTFIATILIVLILIVYGLVSGVIKSVNFSGDERVTSAEFYYEKYLIDDRVYDYMQRISASNYVIDVSKDDDVLVDFWVLIGNFKDLEGKPFYPSFNSHRILLNKPRPIDGVSYNYEKQEISIIDPRFPSQNTKKVIYIYPGTKFIFELI